MITVNLIKPAKSTTIIYHGELLIDEPNYRVVRARWERAQLDLGYVVFEPGDVFDEHFYTERWYNIFAISSVSGIFKGWYCNVTRPATFADAVITSEDLELDLFVSPDRTTILRLDLDEFALRGLDRTEPAAHAAALSALDELEGMARNREGVFS